MNNKKSSHIEKVRAFFISKANYMIDLFAKIITNQYIGNYNK